jgi:putative hydrolase of the HAD superfamily
MAKLLLFDLGNVVINFSTVKTLKKMSEISGISEDVISTRVNFGNEIFQRFERGEISRRRFNKEISEKIGYDFSDCELEICFNAMFGEVTPGIEDMINTLKTDYNVAALSNTNEIHERFVLQKFNRTLGCFDKLFLSHRIRSRKPEKAAFNAVMDYYKVEPSDILFFDDNPVNVNMASRCGIRSTLVCSLDDIKNSLADAGIYV